MMLMTMIVNSLKWINSPFPSDIKLRAVNSSINLHRFYNIFTSKDLFGFTCIHTCYGRIGTKGRMKSYTFGDESKAENFLNSILKKRLSSSKRIGVNYEKF
jgi:predicted DNA-binding WGR domain protein